MYSRLRSLACVALLVVLPFSGIRVICVDPATAGADPAASPETKATEATPTDCERLCPFHPPSAVQGLHGDAAAVPSEDSDCALSSDAAALQMMGTIAVLRSASPLTIPYVVADVLAAAPPFYADPSLLHFTPPPKLQAR